MSVAAKWRCAEALGASRGRLVRQLMTEYLVLAIAGGMLGVLVGGWALAYLVSLVPQALPRAGEIVLDGRVFAFALAATLIVGVLVGIMPAQLAGRVDPQACLATGGSARATRRTSGRLLVALQAAPRDCAHGQCRAAGAQPPPPCAD